MRLAEFILANVEPILEEWESFARSIWPGTVTTDPAELRDHAEAILRATVADMRLVQTARERAAKSWGARPGNEVPPLNAASEQHSVERLRSGFDLMMVVSEYRALRASVLRLWSESGPELVERDVDDVTRFDEAIDQSLAKAVASYTKSLDQSRDLFLAILGHDLRNPLNSIATSAALLPEIGRDDPEAVGVVSQISTSAQIMGRMISDLLDYTRTRLGAGMPVAPAAMDLEGLAKDVFHEYHAANPQRDIRFQAEGDLTGQWDTDRVRQAVSNVLGNAVQHSGPEARIEMRLRGEASHVVVEVWNNGSTIPPGEISRVFDPLVRGADSTTPRRNRPGSIGLGLYIAHEIATAHGGAIDVTSTDADGTTFTLRLPRLPRLPRR